VRDMLRTVAAVALLAAPAVIPAGAARAGGPAEATLRAQTHAVDRAIETQIQASGRSAPYGVSNGARIVTAPGGAVLRADPAPGSPVLDHLGVGAPVVVTRPVGGGGWVEVLSGGSRGYIWAPQLTPQGFPPPPWGATR